MSMFTAEEVKGGGKGRREGGGGKGRREGEEGRRRREGRGGKRRREGKEGRVGGKEKKEGEREGAVNIRLDNTQSWACIRLGCVISWDKAPLLATPTSSGAKGEVLLRNSVHTIGKAMM